jgi:hypothetical protein
MRGIMIRKAVGLIAALLLAGCAAKTPAPVGPAPVPLPPPPPRQSAPPAFDGLSSDALKTRLGPPAFSRKDGGTEMWRYDVKDCHAFFFFTAGKVSHVETIPRPANQTTDAACLSALPKKVS